MVEQTTKLNIRIKWVGPFSVKRVIEEMGKGGKDPDWDGEDYGLYQIYGKHILCKKDTLLYIGEATEQTFSTRFKQHQHWLCNEESIRVYLGQIYNPQRHSKKDNWHLWEEEVKLAERILIYKYSPNYNNTNISDPPVLGFEKVRLIHKGNRHKLRSRDNAPEDYQES